MYAAFGDKGRAEGHVTKNAAFVLRFCFFFEMLRLFFWKY